MARHVKKKSDGGFLRTFLLLGVLFVVVSLVSYYMVGYFLSKKIIKKPTTKVVHKIKKDLPPFPEVIKEESPNMVRVFVYYGDADSRHFDIEQRFVKKAPMDVMVREVIDKLLKGPSVEGSISVIPKGVVLKHVFIGDGVVYLDFNSAIVENHPGGSRAELLTVYSIVDTVVANFLPDIREVQILVDGKVVPTLKEHIDISKPLIPDKDIF